MDDSADYVAAIQRSVKIEQAALRRHAQGVLRSDQLVDKSEQAVRDSYALLRRIKAEEAAWAIKQR